MACAAAVKVWRQMQYSYQLLPLRCCEHRCIHWNLLCRGLLHSSLPLGPPHCRYIIPGGSAGWYEREGYRFDVGSSMMFGMGDAGTTNLITRALAAVGKRLETIPDPTQIHYHLPKSAAHPQVHPAEALQDDRNTAPRWPQVLQSHLITEFAGRLTWPDCSL